MKGYGRILLAEALARHAALFPGQPNRIGAQQRLEKFYREFGFETGPGKSALTSDDFPTPEGPLSAEVVPASTSWSSRIPTFPFTLVR